jgi:ATP-dependent DNA ligase
MSPGRHSWNVEPCWNRSSNQWPAFQLGSFVEGQGKALFDLTEAKGMEGIVAKRKEGVYRPGKRSSDWLKIKSRPQQELWSADSPKAKEAGSIWALCYWALTRTEVYIISVIQGADSARKG